MEKIVLDTSVIVKWFVEEQGSKKAKTFLEKYKKGKIQIIEPTLVSLELANALFWGAEFSDNLLEKSLAAFHQLEIDLFPLNLGLITQAKELMCQFKVTIYDALFLSLAQKTNSALITADKKHHRPEIYEKIAYL